MDLGKLNKLYWSQYAQGTTPGIDEMPSVDLLEGLTPHANVLDVGTGTGKLAEYLAALEFSVYGIDINDNEIAANKTRGSEVVYSHQDIAEQTDFSDSFFDLVIFRYTLTNIHKAQWAALTAEIGRITKLGGYVWLAEPHINEAYDERYKLGKQKLEDEHALYVFKDKDKAAQIKDAASLEAAIAADEVSRIVRHYDEAELADLFPEFKPVDTKHVSHTSPSGYPLDTVIMTFRKGKDN